MPPVTPRRTRAIAARPDERGRIVVEGALAELMVVVVDLPRTLGGDDHERVTLRDALEELIDAGMDHGLDMLPGRNHFQLPANDSRNLLDGALEVVVDDLVIE